jgi:hypothetical protein
MLRPLSFSFACGRSLAMAARCIRLLGIVSFVLSFALTTQNSLLAVGQEFHIETSIYVGEEEEPASHTVTLFEKSAVYEFVDEPEQVIIYRAGSEGRASQFILLDVELERRTDIDVERVEKLIEKMNRWAAEHKDPLLKFSAAPKFDEKFNADSGSLSLTSPEWSYRVATINANDDASLRRYHEFTDRYAELTTMLYNSPPPGPRLALNAAMAKHGVVPVEIHRTIGGEDKNAVRATHLFSWRLSRDDRARLDEAQAYLANFEKVDNEKFITARLERDKEVVRGQSK